MLQNVPLFQSGSVLSHMWNNITSQLGLNKTMTVAPLPHFVSFLLARLSYPANQVLQVATAWGPRFIAHQLVEGDLINYKFVHVHERGIVSSQRFKAYKTRLPHIDCKLVFVGIKQLHKRQLSPTKIDQMWEIVWLYVGRPLLHLMQLGD